MNVSHLTADERIERIVDRALWEMKRKKRGPLYHLLARLHESEKDVVHYKNFSQWDETNNATLTHARGYSIALGYSISVLMKYRHRIPGVEQDEIDIAIKRLADQRAFEFAQAENLPVPV